MRLRPPRTAAAPIQGVMAEPEATSGLGPSVSSPEVILILYRPAAPGPVPVIHQALPPAIPLSPPHPLRQPGPGRHALGFTAPGRHLTVLTALFI
jgi:hypothetical protein